MYSFLVSTVEFFIDNWLQVIIYALVWLIIAIPLSLYAGKVSAMKNVADNWFK